MNINLKFTAGFLIILAMFISGCSRGNDSKEGKESGQKMKVAGIVFQEDQFFRLVQIGMNAAAADLGVELLEGNSDNKLDKEIQLVNTYITNKVDAIAIAPLSVAGSVAALKRAEEKGIKVIIHNNTLESDVVSGAVESDQRDLGRETGKAARSFIETKLSGKAKVAILAFKSQLPEQSNARSEGFKEEIKKLPGVEIVAEQDAWLPEVATKKAGDILTANPGINIIWSANEGGTVGSVLAVKNAGKKGAIAVFGTDISNQLMDFLQSDDNILQAVTGQRPFDIGYQAVQMAVKIVKAEKHDKKIVMTGVLLSRDDMNGVKEFQKKYKELVSGSANKE